MLLNTTNDRLRAAFPACVWGLLFLCSSWTVTHLDDEPSHAKIGSEDRSRSTPAPKGWENHTFIQSIKCQIERIIFFLGLPTIWLFLNCTWSTTIHVSIHGGIVLLGCCCPPRQQRPYSPSCEPATSPRRGWTRCSGSLVLGRARPTEKAQQCISWTHSIDSISFLNARRQPLDTHNTQPGAGKAERRLGYGYGGQHQPRSRAGAPPILDSVCWQQPSQQRPVAGQALQQQQQQPHPPRHHGTSEGLLGVDACVATLPSPLRVV